MSPSASPAAWQRLGELLIRRRVELDPRYQNRTVFAAERGLDYRLAYDIEEAKRPNFRKGTLAGIALAYDVTYDSVEAVLSGSPAPLEPLPATRSAEAPAAPRPPSDDSKADDLEVAVRLLIGVVENPTLREMLASIWRLEHDGRPAKNRAELLRTALELHNEYAGGAVAPRRNGTTN